MKKTEIDFLQHHCLMVNPLIGSSNLPANVSSSTTAEFNCFFVELADPENARGLRTLARHSHFFNPNTFSDLCKFVDLNV